MGPISDLPGDADFAEVIRSIDDRRRGIKKYVYLLERLRKTDVSSDIGYQSAFESFYVVRLRGGEWMDAYFEILEREKHNEAVCFESVLKKMWCATRRVEASFSSKLVATIDPDQPVWDRWALQNLNLKKVYGRSSDPKYVDRCVSRYAEICKVTKAIVQQGARFRKWTAMLDRHCPQYKGFTEVKKLDLFLWLYRP